MKRVFRAAATAETPQVSFQQVSSLRKFLPQTEEPGSPAEEPGSPAEEPGWKENLQRLRGT